MHLFVQQDYDTETSVVRAGRRMKGVTNTVSPDHSMLLEQRSAVYLALCMYICRYKADDLHLSRAEHYALRGAMSV
jgi:hypothetical protein